MIGQKIIKYSLTDDNPFIQLDDGRVLYLDKSEKIEN